MIYNNIKIKENIYLNKDNIFIWPNNFKNSDKNQETCLGTRNHIVILIDETVIPCCLDSNGSIKFGNIYLQELDEMLKSNLFNNINQGFKNTKIWHNLCKNCTFRILKFDPNSKVR